MPSTFVPVLVLDMPQSRVDAELPAARRKLSVSPNGWSSLARMGRLLRYAGDRAGLDLLREAADAQLSVDRDSVQSVLNAGVLLRLAGEGQRSDELLHQVHERLPGDPDGAADLLEVSVLLRRDEDALHIAEGPLAGETDERLRHRAVAELARGRLQQETARCAEAVDWFDRAIAAEPRSLASTAVGMTPYDWLEEALVVQSRLSGIVSARLREM